MIFVLKTQNERVLVFFYFVLMSLFVGVGSLVGWFSNRFEEMWPSVWKVGVGITAAFLFFYLVILLSTWVTKGKK